MAEQFLAPWWPQTLRRGISAELPATGYFLSFISTCFEIWSWNVVYKNALGGMIHQVWVPASGEFSRLFSKCFEVSIWKLFRTLGRLHTFHQNGFSVTVFMFLAYAQLTNKAFTDTDKRAYYAISDCYCLNYDLAIFSQNCTCKWTSCSIMKKKTCAFYLNHNTSRDIGEYLIVYSN